MTSAPTSRASPALGLRQLALGGVLALLASALVMGTLWLAVTDQAAGPRPATPVAEATPIPTLPLPTAPPTVFPSATPSPVPTICPTPPLPTQTSSPILYPSCPTPAGWLPYQVQPGDTLYALAWRAGTSVFALIESNCLEGETLQAGRIIYLPPSFFATPTAVPCGPPPGWVRYIVQRGDTLWNLSYRLGISIEAIRQANCLYGYTIRVGQPLYLPAYPPTVTSPPTLTPTATGTPTPWPTFSPTTTTPVFTTTPTLIPTPTLTPTSTPTSTWTPTPTPTSTPTLTPTFTPTPTPTSSPTPP